MEVASWLQLGIFVLAVLGAFTWLHKDIGNIRDDVTRLRERMARVEALLEKFTGMKPDPAANPPELTD